MVEKGGEGVGIGKVGGWKAGLPRVSDEERDGWMVQV